MFVVYLTPASDEKPFKAFAELTEARRFAKEQTEGDVEKAEIYKVEGIDSASKAIAVVKMSEGVFVEAVTQRYTGPPRPPTAADLGF